MHTSQLYQMRDGLARMRDELSDFTIKHGPDPAPGSQAIEEELSFDPPTPVVDARGHAAHLIQLCGDHTTALVKTLTPPVEVMAPWSCLRVLVEAAAVASWLLDPAADARERARRNIAHFAAGTERLRVFANAAGRYDDLALAAKRSESASQFIERAGFDAVPRMPSSTDLVEKLLDNPWLYRLSSAVVHGHLWTLPLCYETIPISSTSAAGVPMGGIEKTAKADMLAYVVAASAQSLVRPFWNQCIYLGWHRDELQQILERGFDAMTLSDRLRFWHRG